MRVEKTMGPWAVMGYVSTAEAPSLPVPLAGKLGADLLLLVKRRVGVAPLCLVFFLGASASGRP